MHLGKGQSLLALGLSSAGAVRMCRCHIEQAYRNGSVVWHPPVGTPLDYSALPTEAVSIG